MLVFVFWVVAVKVIRVSDLSRPSQSLTLAMQSARSISDLCESHAMDSIDHLRSLLTQSLRSIGIRSGWSQSHACIPFDSESWASQCLTVSLAVGGASRPSPRPSTEPHQPAREHALTQPRQRVNRLRHLYPVNHCAPSRGGIPKVMRGSISQSPFLSRALPRVRGSL